MDPRSRPSSYWSDLPPELLAQIIAGLPLPDDKARFRAVCRPWHQAMRHHAPPQLPWIVYPDGTFVTFPDHVIHRGLPFPFPVDTTFICADGSWLAFYRTNPNDRRRTYLLHNPFTRATLPLPALDAIIGYVSYLFKIRKVLVRKDEDIVVVTTNNWYCPIILCRPGRPGAWLPPGREKPFASIFDVVFHEDSLYGVTDRNDLVVMDLDEDDDGVPTVIDVRCIIKHPSGDADEEEDEEEEYHENVEGDIFGYNAEVVDYNEAANVDEESEDFEDIFWINGEFADDPENKGSNLYSCDYEQVPGLMVDALSIKWSEDLFSDYEQVLSNKNEEEVASVLGDSIDNMAMPRSLEVGGDARVPDGVELVGFLVDDQGNPEDGTETSRHLFESNGELLLVKREKYHPASSPGYTRKIEVLEADMEAGVWIPATTNVSGTLFVSGCCSKHVSTSEEEARKGLKCHFADEHDLKYQPYFSCEGKPTWLFPQKIVV